MHARYYHYTNLIHGSQHALQHESFLNMTVTFIFKKKKRKTLQCASALATVKRLMVTIVEIHMLILDVCVSQHDSIEVFKI